MRAYERLLRYVQVFTTSDEESISVPTAAREFDLAIQVAEELKALGVADAHVDGSCYVYGHIPATPGYEKKPRIGFIAHLDTAPDFCGENVKPVIHENYDGKDVALGAGRVLSAKTFPHLRKLKGRTLITADGTTLLGADDKAGVAEIVTMAERLLAGEIPHGPVSIAFTPDEEVGAGAAHFDLEEFAADFAYTVDGGPEGEIVFENFNAASARAEFAGFNIHPGEAKDKMVNAQLVAMEFHAMLPAGDAPRFTQGYEGFFHLCAMEGSVEKAGLVYIIRDHDRAKFEARKELMRHNAEILNDKYGPGTVKLSMRDQYYNMYDKVLPNRHLIDNAFAAIKAVGLKPRTEPIRGGTDGAMLSYQGLPCPNLGTGGYAFHGPYEHITAEGMDICTDILVGILREYAK